MGNSFEGKSNLLAKNWTKINSSTYQNIITEELIDQYRVKYESEEEMIINHSLLMKRANVNHPNIIKLIYFYQSSENGLCTSRIYSHQIFVEHHNQQLLAEVNFAEHRSVLKECFCCPIVNGLAFLCSKYGYFKVTDSMIFSSSQPGWQRSGSKKTAKVWINQRLQLSEAQIICSQSQMCQSILSILQKMVEKGICNQEYIQYCNRIHKVDELLSYVYKVHNNIYQVEPQGRKRVLSSISSGHDTLLNTIELNRQSQNTPFIKNNKTFSNNQHVSTKALNKTFETKRRIQVQTITRIVKPQNKVKESINLFYKPQQQPNFKVHFSYNNLITPRQDKSKQEVMIATNRVDQIPIQSNSLKEITPKRNISQNLPKDSEASISQSTLKRKLEEIVESSPQNIAPSPFLAEVNLERDDQRIATIHDAELQESVQQEPQNKQSSPHLNVSKQIINHQSIKLSSQLQQSMVLDNIQNKQYFTALEFEDIENTPIYSVQTPRGQDIEPPKIYHTPRERQTNYYDKTSQLSSKSPNYSKLESNYSKYLEKFNNAIHPKSNSSRKFAPNLQNQTQLPINKTTPKSIGFKFQPYHENSLNFQQTYGRNHQRPTKNAQFQMQMSDGFANKKAKATNRGQLQSVYNYSELDSEQQNKKMIIQKIENTEKKIRQNRKKLEKIELEKDLEREKAIIKKEMEGLLKNNLMNDETNRIKEKVKHKNATFAELKAEASKILEDLNF